MRSIWLKKYSRIALMLVLLFYACSDNGDDKTDEPEPAVPEITIPPGTDLKPVIGAESKEPVSFEFTTTAPWSISVVNTRADSWISIYPLSGDAGKNSITITAQENKTYDERSATITITSGNVKQNIVITQKQCDALTVTSDKVELDADGGAFTIEVKHNVQVTVESKVDWIKEAPTSRALQTTKYSFIAEANSAKEGREGKIVVSNGDLKDTVWVYQMGLAPSIILTTHKETVAAEGKDITVKLASNVDYRMKFSQECDWIEEITTKSVSTHTLYFKVKKNEMYDVRKVQLIFCNDTYSVGDTLLVEQASADGLLVQEKDINVEADGGRIVLNIDHNVNYDIAVSDNWIKQVNTRALVRDRLSFDVASNTSTASRTGSITVSGSGITRTVAVIQAGAGLLLTVDKNDLSFDASGGEKTINVSHNVDFTAEASDSWLKVYVKVDVIYVTAEQNASTTSRAGSVTVSGGGITRTVAVKQQGAEPKPAPDTTGNTEDFNQDAQDW